MTEAVYQRRLCPSCNGCNEHERNGVLWSCANCGKLSPDSDELVPQKRESTVLEHQRLVAKARGNGVTVTELDAAGFKPHTPAPSGEPERGALGELQGNGPQAGGRDGVADAMKALAAFGPVFDATDPAQSVAQSPWPPQSEMDLQVLRGMRNMPIADLKLHAEQSRAEMLHSQLATLRENYDALGAQLKASIARSNEHACAANREHERADGAERRLTVLTERLRVFQLAWLDGSAGDGIAAGDELCGWLDRKRDRDARGKP